MFIVLTLVGLLVIGIICLVVYTNTWYCPEWLFALGIVLTIITGIVLVVMSFCIVGIQVNEDIDYQNKLYEKEMLEYRIENMDENIIGNEMLYNDIVAFNNDLRSVKKWADSLWTNWFNNQKIATIDYIELEDFKR